MNRNNKPDSIENFAIYRKQEGKQKTLSLTLFFIASALVLIKRNALLRLGLSLESNAMAAIDEPASATKIPTPARLLYG